MKAKMKLLLMLSVLVLSLMLSACFEAELPYIGENGNWFIDGVDSGVPANGKDGEKGEKGDTGDAGKDGEKGETGDVIDGDMPVVSSYEKIRDTENGAIYKITFSDGVSTEIEVTNGNDGAAAEETVEVSPIISSFTMLPEGAQIKAESVEAGATLVFPKDKYITASSERVIGAFMKIGELGDGKIYVGQGKNELGGSYVEITKTTVTVYTNAGDSSNPYYIDSKHKLKDVKDFVFVLINSSYGNVKVSLMSASGFFEIKDVMWSGSAGDLFIEADGVALSDVSFTAAEAGASENVWLFIDSTPRSNINEELMYFFNARNYDDNLLVASPSISSAMALAEFNKALAKGTPQFALWAVGANDTEADYKANTDAFLAKCDELGITPILSTAPNKEGCDNTAKNAYVEASGRKYIDYAAVFGAKDAGDVEIGNEFYSGEGDARKLDYGAIVRRQFSELIRALPEIALNKD